jgi:hypothetical protein
VQATVRTFDATSRSGSVFLDDGTRLDFDAEALGAGPARLLRPGQRVDVAVAGGRVTAVTLPGFPPPAGG